PIYPPYGSSISSLVSYYRTIELYVKLDYGFCMRPLHHPNLEEVTVEGVLYALSDPVRARIYARLAASDCTQTCSAFLNVQESPLPKSTLSHHFRILREAGPILREPRAVGRARP